MKKSSMSLADRNAEVCGSSPKAGLWRSRRDGAGQENSFLRPADQVSNSVRRRSASWAGKLRWQWRVPRRKDVLAYPFDAAHLRALVIGSVEIGELMMQGLHSPGRAAFLEER